MHNSDVLVIPHFGVGGSEGLECVVDVGESDPFPRINLIQEVLISKEVGSKAFGIQKGCLEVLKSLLRGLENDESGIEVSGPLQRWLLHLSFDPSHSCVGTVGWNPRISTKLCKYV
jgi:hypothetical protein